MLGWVIGAAVIGLTAWIIIRSVVRMAKGQSGCAGCSHSAGCPRCRAEKLSAEGGHPPKNGK